MILWVSLLLCFKVICSPKPTYSTPTPEMQLFGPTVTTAMKMESHGIPSKVHVSEAVVQRLKNCPKVYNMENRGGDACVPGQETTFLVLAASRTKDAEAKPTVHGSNDRKTFQVGGRAGSLL